ncbi:MAG: DUF1254 domain-containing protein [Bacteroidales bacterium]|nr:DUF1254 domain-containing protein [Bacteroidales bacterium]
MRLLKKLVLASITAGMLFSCQNNQKQNTEINLKDVAYDAFIYAYPMMEQVKTINNMFDYMNMVPNVPAMNPGFPMDNVGQPIVAPNLTSMTGGIFIDISNGPVTIEVPEIKDRYVVYQFVDVFTHNFYYLGSRANNGDGGQFVFYNQNQSIPQNSKATPVLMEGNCALMVNRIDIKDRSELEYVRNLQAQIKVIDAPEKTSNYPSYNKEKAFSPQFVEYINVLLEEIPEPEVEMFERFAKIGINNQVNLSDADLKLVQEGIDSAYHDIQNERVNTQIGNGWIGATELFGTREFLNGNYLNRAFGADFGLWGNSKEEANYFMLFTEGEGEITFKPEELPPLTDIGFWSITIHDGNVFVSENDYQSYVITMDQMQFEEDGSITFKFSKEPQDGNWLYTPSEQIVLAIRASQANPETIGSYVPPAFIQGK